MKKTASKPKVAMEPDEIAQALALFDRVAAKHDGTHAGLLNAEVKA